MRFESYLKTQAARIDRQLRRRMSALRGCPPVLADAMRYSLEAGGKRLRPALAILSARAFGLDGDGAMPAACALEMVHAYSLVHDDLPAMDNDDLRRGKPTNHRVFGEACAVLAGDALLTLAFETVLETAENPAIGPARACRAAACLARAAGAQGMVGGQTADIFAEGMLSGKSRRAAGLGALSARRPAYFLLPSGRPEKAGILDYIHRHKTGALLRAPVEIGAILAGAEGEKLAAAREYGRAIGLAFQIVDDILDVTADKKKLGKSGSDAANGKLTFVTVYGLERARREAARQIKTALAELEKTRLPQSRREGLRALANFVLERTY
ncbi:MAG: polyprenyl synthetase family protein [Elusimicrobiales bacterium]